MEEYHMGGKIVSGRMGSSLRRIWTPSLVGVLTIILILQICSSPTNIIEGIDIGLTVGDGPPLDEEIIEIGPLEPLSSPVLSPEPSTWESYGVHHPMVIERDGQYQMWYNGHKSAVRSVKIGYAESDDGVNWERPEEVVQPVMDVIDDSQWESGEIGYMWVMFDEDTYKMWYSACPSGSFAYQIGYAESDDGIEWDRETTNPVLSPGQFSAYSPVVFKHTDGTYYMWYIDTPGSGKQIWLAVSSDGKDWDSKGRVFGNGDSGADDEHLVGVRDVVYEDGEYKMWYTAGGPGNIWKTFLATSDDGIEWDRHDTVVLIGSGDYGDYNSRRM